MRLSGLVRRSVSRSVLSGINGYTEPLACSFLITSWVAFATKRISQTVPLTPAPEWTVRREGERSSNEVGEQLTAANRVDSS